MGRSSRGRRSRILTKKPTLSRRFADLSEELVAVHSTARQVRDEYRGIGVDVDEHRFLSWKVKARNLLSLACGTESEHYREFLRSEDASHWSGKNCMRLQAVFEAARDDFDGGYLATVRTLVQGELFETELDQARELLAAGYRVPAAVVAGVVLETSLRQLCTDANLPTGKLDKMNSDLAKSGAYNLLVQKRVTALADIRNNAAHGHPERFSDRDVSDMISYVESFLSERLG